MKKIRKNTDYDPRADLLLTSKEASKSKKNGSGKDCASLDNDSGRKVKYVALNHDSSDDNDAIMFHNFAKKASKRIGAMKKQSNGSSAKHFGGVSHHNNKKSSKHHLADKR